MADSTYVAPELVEHEQGFDCGWWPPGAGEPGQDWMFEPARLGLDYEPHDQVLAVHVMTPAGPRALVALPVIAVFRALSAHFAGAPGGTS